MMWPGAWPDGWRSVEWMLYRWGTHYAQFGTFHRDVHTRLMRAFWTMSSGMIPRA